MTVVAAPGLSPFGRALRRWRALRGMSQLDLALEADSSARHLSFIETGRAQPSRAMVLRLAETLDLPLRERNLLLTAAGYAPAFRETPLDAAAMAGVRRALDLMLAKHEPYPALVMDRRFDLVAVNQAAGRLVALMGGGADGGGAASGDESRPPNLLRLMLAPGGLRRHVVDWPAAARYLVARARRELTGAGADEGMLALFEEVLGYPDVPAGAALAEPGGEAPPPVLSVAFERDGLRLAWFSTITTFGTPQDVTLEELHIEHLFPADDATDALAHRLAREDPNPRVG
jgi:transcriptional regulator with XRE-family HTH domain